MRFKLLFKANVSREISTKSVNIEFVSIVTSRCALYSIIEVATIATITVFNNIQIEDYSLIFCNDDKYIPRAIVLE